MATRTTLNVSLPVELGHLIAAKIASGRYASAIEVVRAGLRLQLDMNILLLREANQLGEALLTADAGLLETAERNAEEMLADLIDPDEARLHGLGRMHRR